jgi:hypothetical protein
MTANAFNGILMDCGQGTLTNSMLHCNGLQLVVGKITDSILIHPGAVKSKDNRAMMVGGENKP